MVPTTTAREDHQREHPMDHQQQTQQEKAQDRWEEVGVVTIHHFLTGKGMKGQKSSDSVYICAVCVYISCISLLVEDIEYIACLRQPPATQHQ